MNVYVVKNLVDDEYGTYEVYGIYSTHEKAEKAIFEIGNTKVKTWFNEEGLDEYIIESWKVQ